MTLFLETTQLATNKHNAKLFTRAGRLVANVTRKTAERAESVAKQQAAKMLKGFEIVVKRRTVTLVSLNGRE